MVKGSKVLGGKRYLLNIANLTKAQAQSKAKKYRQSGFLSRAVKYVTARGKTRYAVYSRKKPMQGYNSRMDESLGMRRGAGRTKTQSLKSRRDESKGMSKSMGRRAYASVRSMDKGRRTRR